MMNLRRTRSIAVLLAGALLAAWVPAGSSQAQTPTPAPTNPVPAPTPIPISQVTLSAVSASSTYTLGTPIGIAITLTNNSAGALGLSTIVDGNLVVTSVTRDGVAVPTAPSVTNFDNGFRSALSDSLTSVPAGGSVTMSWTTSFNQSIGGEALKDTDFTGNDIGTGVFYDLSQPGNYSITFHYQYKGPTGRFSGTVFTGRTNAVTVTFNVV